MPWVKIINRNTNAFADKEKIHGLSIEVILIAFFMIIVLFLIAVSIKQPHKKKGPGVNTLMHDSVKHNKYTAVLPGHSIPLNG